MRRGKMNKRGTLDDAVFILGMLFMIVILVFVSAKIWNGFHNSASYQAMISTSEDAKDIDTYNTDSTFPNMDYMALEMVLGGTFLVMLLAFITRSSPLFLPVGIVATMFIIFVAHYVSDAGVGFMDHPNFAQEKAEYPVTYFIIDNLEMVMLLMCSLVLVATYAFSQGVEI